ncbi:dihydrodipicolinate synthase family protein [Halalkalibacter sp. AB-rgal2]|uniref:dihydrodipicolinate synthase family protein n=1 Tax=Halalkalibacter sp. AB-rgal2 TaxID=3242695 RepID=UPI00359D5137
MNKQYDSTRFRGVFSLLLTPFKEDQSIDWDAYKRYVDWQLSFKPNGLFAVCGTSEMKWLSLDERLKLATIAVECAGSTPVVATANLEDGLEAQKEEMEQMMETGVAGLVLVPPIGMGEDQSRLKSHFAQLLEGVTNPVLLYEWPESKPKYVSPKVYKELVEEYGLMGIKDTTCTMKDIMEKIKGAKQSIIYQANTPFMYEAFKHGAQGMMAITTSAYTDVAVAFWNAAEQGMEEEAIKWYQALVMIDTFMGKAYPVTAKYMVQLRTEIMSTECRWPISLNEETKQAIQVCVSYIDSIGVMSK